MILNLLMICYIGGMLSGVVLGVGIILYCCKRNSVQKLEG